MYMAATENTEKPPDNMLSHLRSRQAAWAPSPEMKRALQVCQQSGFSQPIQSIMRKASIPLGAWYRWWNSAHFREWWCDQAEKTMMQRLPEVHEAMIDRAIGDRPDADPVAAKLVLERFDPKYIGSEPAESHNLVMVLQGIQAQGRLESEVVDVEPEAPRLPAEDQIGEDDLG
jgi:hypothetical protein